MRETLNIDCKQIPLGRITSLFHRVAYLNSNHSYGRNLLALGVIDELVVNNESDPDPLAALETYFNQDRDWLFGYLSFDLKNRVIPSLKTSRPDKNHWPLLHFFRPEIVVEQEGTSCRIHYYHSVTSNERLAEIIDCLSSPDIPATNVEAEFQQLVDAAEYVKTVQQIQHEIQAGNIYELNYCIPFEATVADLDTVSVYQRLNDRTQAPFSVYYQDQNRALMSGSPERYLKKTGRKLISQPIKGTIRRGVGTSDEMLKEQLRNDPKERAENIMITDLVRNDLSRVAAPQSVKVDELCGIYTFRTVHQMISTVSATLAEDKSAVDAIRCSFPMGSMTGAPKISALNLIDRFEICSRGLYSGSFGYFTPSGDFDFNVIIRSMLYNYQTGNLSFEVGSAITSLSDPEAEYHECLLKAEALLRATKPADDGI